MNQIGSFSSPEAVVRAFCAAIAGRSTRDVVPYLAEGIRYHNIPLDPVVGRDAVQRELARQFDSYESLEFRIDVLAAGAGVVMTERVDLLGRDGAVIEMPVMGVFEVRDGLIQGWRDYFDLGQFRMLVAAARPAPPSGAATNQTTRAGGHR